ncbi:lysoplasmalogenase [Chitinophaga qingshengii]|uniref:Lysoplasmalogenase n=1 Tax=Chitinophaga qingshengii TaxID=1569794 RepID=A0ABR7TUK5_9BACT|nr:lysoplasmalogenase [Chitinophaga qingshengii]MBC9933678.1 lysoplasmalogenase [Chitinophaga qingshengii]
MNASRWLVLYFLTLLADLILISLNMDGFRFATKPLLVPLLAVYFLSADSMMPGKQRAWMYGALVFCLLGDVLLMFDHLFLSGLGCFLVGHVFYIIFFLTIRYSNPPVPHCKYLWVFLNAAAVIGYILFLAPYLGTMVIPVIIYSLVISIMLQSVIHAFHFRYQRMAWYCVIGALLFVVSDSLIALGRFYHPLPGGGQLVMLTYGLAQAGLVYGAVQYYRR